MFKLIQTDNYVLHNNSGNATNSQITNHRSLRNINLFSRKETNSMRICTLETVRLRAVSDKLNEEGVYTLESFDIKDADFNQEFDIDSLDDELYALVDYLYGGGHCIEVDEDEVETIGKFLRIRVDGECIELPNVLDSIDTDPDNAKTYLLVDKTLEDACWVVAERCSA